MPVSRVAIAVFLVVLLFTLYLTIELFWAFITPIVLALVLVSIFSPLYRWFLSTFRGQKHAAAILTMILVILGVTLPFSFFITTLSKQALQFYEGGANADSLLGNLLTKFSSQHSLIVQIQHLAGSIGIDISADKLVQSFDQILRSFSLMVYDYASQLVSNALSIVFNFVITMVLVYTLFIAGNDLKEYLMDLSPLPLDEKERLVKQFSEISRAVFVGNGVISFLEGLCGGLGMYWFGMGPAIFWGVLIAFSAFLPVVGAWIIIGPAAFVLLLEGNSSMAVVYLFYNAVYLIICEFMIKPQLIGGKSRMHAVLVLLSVLGGVQMFGVLGIFYGPMVVTMFLTLIQIYKEHYEEYLLNLQK